MTRPPHASGPTVAVLGGGQLGRMLGLAGVPLGLGFRFLDPSPDAPAAAVGRLVVGPLGDEAALAEVADGADVVTYEWEGVPSEAARFLAARGLDVRPPAAALDAAQDRVAEKGLLRRIGIAVPEFAAVETIDGLWAAIADTGLPAVLKTRRGGYDGKGQAVLRGPSDVEPGWLALRDLAPLAVEAWVPFDRELSILAVRARDGATAYWPLIENVHEDGILRASRAPAPGVAPELQATAEGYAARVLDKLDYVGVLAVELFEAGGELLANELAPRVHNSGHWTIEGAATSQFENHLRAVLGWPLGSTAPDGVAAMVNCIGVLPEPAAVLAVDGAHLHRYGKAPRRGRKVGHVTVVAADDTELDARLAALRAALPPDDG